MSSVRLRDFLKARPTLALTAVLIGSASIAATAWAMRVSPMVSELTTVGVGSAARIEVGNVGSLPLPFETLITRMDLDADENLIETPSDDNFLVFPPQGLVAVGGRQVIRVQWVGRPDLEASESYYLWVKQLPVNTTVDPVDPEVSVANLQVLYTMKALVVVAPPGAEPDVRVKNVEVIDIAVEPAEASEQEAGEELQASTRPGVRVTVQNKGRRYALMAGATWTIKGTDLSGQSFLQTYPDDQISQYVGVGFLPPLNGQRRFDLPTSAALDSSKPIEVVFSR